MHSGVQLQTRFPVNDRALSALHARAWGSVEAKTQLWARRLERYSLTWVGAFAGDTLIGFVHACWDGGAHAFVLDTCVDPDHQRTGVGQLLVERLVSEVRAAGCEWLHVDYEPHLEAFYRGACGFDGTHAGLLQLSR